jgi:hypothetical protein
MRSAGFVVAAAAVAAVAVASSLFVGCSLFTDLGGLSDDAVPGDGGGRESGSSSGGEGGGTNPEAGGLLPDSGGAPDGKAPNCPATARLCDDFERATSLLLGPWDDQFISGGGALTIENGKLVATVPGRPGVGTEPLAFLQKTIPGALTKFTVDMDVGFNQRPPTAADYHLFVRVRIDVPGGGFQLVYLTIDNLGNGFALQDFTTTTMLEYKGFTMDTAIHHVKVEYALGGKSRLSIDGATIHEINTPAFMKAGTMQLMAGVSGSQGDGATTPVTVTTDNVIFLAE